MTDPASWHDRTAIRSQIHYVLIVPLMRMLQSCASSLCWCTGCLWATKIQISVRTVLLFDWLTIVVISLVITVVGPLSGVSVAYYFAKHVHLNSPMLHIFSLCHNSANKTRLAGTPKVHHIHWSQIYLCYRSCECVNSLCHQMNQSYQSTNNACVAHTSDTCR